MSIRIDEDVKRESEKLFGELGLTLFGCYERIPGQAMRHGGIHFDVRIGTPIQTTIAAL